jgi:hypothetical protein
MRAVMNFFRVMIGVPPVVYPAGPFRGILAAKPPTGDVLRKITEKNQQSPTQAIPVVAEPKKPIEFIAVSYKRLVSRPGYENEAIEVTASIRPGETLDDVLLGCQAEVNARLGMTNTYRDLEGAIASDTAKLRSVQLELDELNRRRERRSRYFAASNVETSDSRLAVLSPKPGDDVEPNETTPASEPATITMPSPSAIKAEIDRVLKRLKELRALLTVSNRAAGVKPTPRKRAAATA